MTQNSLTDNYLLAACLLFLLISTGVDDHCKWKRGSSSPKGSKYQINIYLPKTCTIIIVTSIPSTYWVHGPFGFSLRPLPHAHVADPKTLDPKPRARAEVNAEILKPLTLNPKALRGESLNIVTLLSSKA